MPFWISNATIFLGRTLADLGRAKEGVEHSLRGIALQDEMGTKVNLSSLRANHAITLLLAGRSAEAHQEAERALRSARETQGRGSEAAALATMGRVLFASGIAELNTAVEAYVQGLALSEELGMRPLSALCLLGLGRSHRQIGDEVKATEHLSIAAAMFREMDMPFYLKQAEN